MNDRCERCWVRFGPDEPPGGWFLEETGQTVCQDCCVDDLCRRGCAPSLHKLLCGLKAKIRLAGRMLAALLGMD